MFYRLRSEYILRGWEGMSWVLVKRPDNMMEVLTQEQFQTLMLCDGETEITEELLDESNEILKNTLLQCQKKEWIEARKEPSVLADEQYYVYYRNRCVRRVFWSITGRCNFKCRHCYVDSPNGTLGEISTQQALDFIDQMAACGVLQVDITGGEPFVRKDFWLLIDRMLSYKIAITGICTNGWLINNSLLDEFEKRNIKPAIQVSFDGVGWHDWMRGVPGAEQSTLRALSLLHNRGYDINVSMCLHRGNLFALPQTVETLKTVGVEDLNVCNVDATNLWREKNEGNGLTLQEYVESLMSYIPWYYKMGCPIEHLSLGGVIELYCDRPYSVNVSKYDGTEQTLEQYLCNVVRWNCYITPEGRLLPCMPMAMSSQKNKFPLIQDIGLRKGLDDSFYMKFVNSRVRDLMAVNNECATCSYRYKCGGGCRAAALTKGEHNLMGCDREKCMLHKNGYEERIRKIADEAIAKYGAPFAIENGSGVNE